MTLSPLKSPESELLRGLELLDAVHALIVMFLVEEGGELTFYNDGEIDYAQANKFKRYKHLREIFADKIIADRNKS